jgi:hypothetical protein
VTIPPLEVRSSRSSGEAEAKLGPVNTQAPAAKSDLDREWWLRTLAIFQSPRTVFAALRDDSDESAGARQEPVLLLVILAGATAVLTAPSTATLMDNPERDGLLVAVLVFILALIYGAAFYWLGGLAVYLGMRGAGGKGTYRRARHVLGFAAAPAALALVVWALEIAVYGGDLFRTGGSDAGVGHWIFETIEAAFFLWSFGLLVYGVQVVEGWKLVRALGALGLTALVLVGIGLIPGLL